MTSPRSSLDSVSFELTARAIGATLRDAAAASTTPERLADDAARLRRAVALSRPAEKSRSLLRVALAAALFCGLFVVGGYLFRERAASPLSLEAQVSASAGSGSTASVFKPVGPHYVAYSDEGSTELRFGDGSRVVVDAGARLRVQELYSTGANLLLEKGKAAVQIVHRARGTHWNVAAGPFLVTVTGTRFDISWEPASERILVELFDGQVEIEGPKLSSPATLKAGQRFEATAQHARWSISPLGERSAALAVTSAKASSGQVATAAMPKVDAPAVAAAAVEPALRTRNRGRNANPRQTTVAVQPVAVASPALPEGRQWGKLVAAGEFKQVTREADAMGLMNCLSQCTASDLRALADASRYTGRLDTAEAALRVLHDKFAGQSATSSYLLGAIDEARGRNVSALRWYDEYLSRTNSGGFVAEARAARLRMLFATGGRSSAQKAAREYLETYPNGSAAGLATKVLESR